MEILGCSYQDCGLCNFVDSCTISIKYKELLKAVEEYKKNKCKCGGKCKDEN